MSKPKYTEKEQQAINGVIVVLDSLPGYKKEPIYFNGYYVGYKYEPIEQTERDAFRIESFPRYQIWKASLNRILKWNW